MFLSDAGGVGLNLQRAASACINLELPWNPAALEQRIGRIYRLGQKLPIDVYNLVSETGIESHIADLVGAKQALFSGLFDGTSDEVRFDAAASFLTRVERIVDPSPLPEAPRAEDATETEDEGEIEGTLHSSENALGEPAIADQLPPAREAPLLPPGPELTNANHSIGEGLGAADAEASAASSVAALFAALRIERSPEGAVRIEASPEAAESLVALFEGMAKILSAASLKTAS